jgi:hypothetical protein
MDHSNPRQPLFRRASEEPAWDVDVENFCAIVQNESNTIAGVTNETRPIEGCMKNQGGIG